MSIYVKNFGDYEVKGVKSFVGMDGYGFNATLYRKGKKVAFCIDEGCGGEVRIDWLAKTPKDVDDKEGWKKYHAAVKVEEDLLDAHIATLPEVDGLKIDAGWFVTDCVSKYELDRDARKMKKQCQTKILFRTSKQKNGGYMIIDAPFSDKAREHVLNKYGKDTEIFNDVFENGGIPSVLQV